MRVVRGSIAVVALCAMLLALAVGAASAQGASDRGGGSAARTGGDVAFVLAATATEYRTADQTHDEAGARRVRGLVSAALGQLTASPPADRLRAAQAIGTLRELDRALRATHDRLQPWPLIPHVERLLARTRTALAGGTVAAPTRAPTIDAIRRTLEAGAAAASAGHAAAARFQRALAWAQYASGPRLRVQAQDALLDERIAAAVWDGTHGVTKGLDRDLATAAQVLGQVEVNRTQIVTDAAILVFREGLEGVLILAAITASFVGARRRLRRPIFIGAFLGLIASVLTWVAAQTIIRSLGSGGLRLEAITGLLAIGVLLLVTNWFFHRIYWSQWIARFNRRRKLLERFDRTGFISGQTLGFVLLGLTSVYREGFETVLFLQSLQVSAGTGATLLGTAIGLGGTLLVGVCTFLLHRKLPYKRMLIATGVMIAVVLAVMVGTTAHVLQGLGWLSTTPTAFELPRWCTTWFGMHATWEGLVAQVGALVFVVGSYVVARELQVHRPQRRARRARAAEQGAI